MIDIEHANPFVSAALDSLEAVAMARPRCGIPLAGPEMGAQALVRGVVSFAGESSGQMAVTFPDGLARRLHRCLAGEEAPGLTAEVRDAVGEVANRIAGGAKARLARRGETFRLGTPEVVVVAGPAGRGADPAPYLVVPFLLYGEPFWLELQVTRSGGGTSQGECGSGGAA